jgi:ribonucleoside-diphosphate reductase alpha chain
MRLAEERGPIPNYKGSAWDKKNLIQRNATTTIAPTGTLSIIAGTSSGIEPIYDIEYQRVLFGDTTVQVRDPLYDELTTRGEERELTDRLFRRAYQITPNDHLRIQRVFQNHVDNAVSKTINLPQHATPRVRAG